MQSYFDRLRAMVRRQDGWVVDIGASHYRQREDGLENDPCYALFKEGRKGLAIDLELDSACRDLPSNVTVKEAMVTPQNGPEVLKDVRGGIALLKIDIDGWDGDLLRSLMLDGFRPSVVDIEIQPEIPPPIEFSVLYDPQYKHGGTSGFYGCSLGYLNRLMGSHSYRLEMVEFGRGRVQNACFVPGDEVDAVPLYYRNKQGPLHLMQSGVDSRKWWKKDANSIVGDVWYGMAKASMAKQGRVTPFWFASGA